MQVRRSSVVIPASAGIVVLMVFAFAPGAVAAPIATSPAASGGPSWAYSQVRSASIGPLYTVNGWEYEGSATIGFSVILNQTNDSAGPSTLGLEITRTEGVAISLEFCHPSCSVQEDYANLSMRAWERSITFANFTTQGNVTEEGANVPALALMNANWNVHANLTERTFSALRSTIASPAVDRMKYLSASVESTGGVTFTPALGVLPLNLLSLDPSNASWNATSEFAAVGSVESTYYYAFHGPVLGNITSGPTTVTSSFQPSGTVTLSGSFASPNGVSLGDLGRVPAIRLAVSEPFLIQDGIVLLPTGADLFGSPSQPWGGVQASGATASLATVNAVPTLDGHFGAVASSRSYSLTSSNPANVSAPAENASASLTTAITEATNPVESTTLQGEPTSVDDASSNSQCLVTGVGCASPSPALRPYLGAAVLAVAVVGIAGLVAAVVIVDRRRMPPAAYPNAGLYPPGAGGAVPPARGARPAGTPEPPPEDDPLNHLW